MDTSPPAERTELLERLKLAHAECRAEIALGWDRARSFLTLSAAASATVLAAPFEREFPPLLAVFAALFPAAGVLVALRSHGRYRAARDAMKTLESWLSYESRAPRAERYHVLDVIGLLFVMLALLDLAIIGQILRWS